MVDIWQFISFYYTSLFPTEWECYFIIIIIVMLFFPSYSTDFVQSPEEGSVS